jgi:2,3-dihydro-2,3-dihydroxybenzoate dehydrogenase
MNGSVAVVTGAAGGIGGSITNALVEQGAVVAAIDRASEPWPSSPSCESGRVIRFQADVSCTKQVEDIIDGIERDIGPIEHLVNAAGVLRPGAVVDLDDDDWAATFAANATGVLVLTRAVLTRMIERRRGAVVTVASNAAHVPRTSMAAYSASKAAAVAFTKCAGLEVASYGIRCNVVLPGSTDTGMLRVSWEGEDRERPTIEGSPSTYRVGIPLGRIASPDDIADGVLFLLSDRARHITMTELTIDGGAALGV